MISARTIAVRIGLLRSCAINTMPYLALKRLCWRIVRTEPYLDRHRWAGINVLRRELIVLKELGKLTL